MSERVSGETVGIKHTVITTGMKAPPQMWVFTFEINDMYNKYMGKSLLQRIAEANQKKKESEGGDQGLVARISRETGIPLNPRSQADVETAQRISKASEASPPPSSTTEGRVA